MAAESRLPDDLSYYHSVEGAEQSATIAARRIRADWLLSDESPFAVHDLDGRGYVYAKRELLVAARDLPRLLNALEQLQVDAKPEHSDELGIVRVQLAPSPNDDQRRLVPDLLTEIRKIAEPDDDRTRPLDVGPNHVFAGEPEYDGGPATAAIPSQTRLSVSGRLGKDVHVTVIDTGYTRGIHPYMDSRITSTGTPELDAQPKDGLIDFEAGHSTFVSGMILRRAPQAEIDVVEVLGPGGFGTEHDIARAIVAHGSSNIINLSLGGYSDDDQPPVALDAALRRVRPGTAVVAAAGNNSSARPMWPAAFKRVIAVGALDETGGPASFSNYGAWVDACTAAVNIVGPFPRFPPEAEAPEFDGWAIWSGTSFAAPKVAGEIAARLSTRRFRTAREAAASLVNDPTRPFLPGLGTVLAL
jgi:subtilisin family serine protease